MASGHDIYASRLRNAWPPRSEPSHEDILENILSQAIESYHDEYEVLALMKKWSEEGRLVRLETDCVSDHDAFCDDVVLSYFNMVHVNYSQ